ncbi:MAG: methyltransferase domain-containing protein [Bacteroidetes bacterium]|nr:methyltransferase domain-containing protein [Bacteroidota bacterium]
MSEKNLKSYWNRVYEKSEVEKLGWYEDSPEPSMRLINKCKLSMSGTILNVGAGASTLIDELLKNGYQNIIASDLSGTSLEMLKNRLGEKESQKVQWIIDDLTKSEELVKLSPIELWHDRAVLHFFTDEKDQDAYFKLLKKIVKKEGFVIIATFNLDGATQCSGLPVCRYNKTTLEEKLGLNFELITDFNHTYKMPSGDSREYVYTLFQRIK